MQFGLGRTAAVAQDDRRRHASPAFLRNREAVRPAAPPGWSIDAFVDLARRHFLAAAVDDLLQAARQRDIALDVDNPRSPVRNQPFTQASAFAFAWFS